MVLSRFGCHRSPFGSFPREGKNSLPHPRMCKRTCAPQAQPKAHHLARNEGGPPVPPGRQRTSDMSPKVPHAAPARKQLASLPMRFLPQAKRRGVRGQPWCCLSLAATGCPLVLSRERERTPPTPAPRAKDPRAIRRSQRPTILRATRAAHRCRPAASRRATQHPKPLQAAPARKPIASLHMRLHPQAKRGGVRGQPWCCLGLAATGRPLVLSREWERTPRTSDDVQRNPAPPHKK